MQKKTNTQTNTQMKSNDNKEIVEKLDNLIVLVSEILKHLKPSGTDIFGGK